MKFSIELFPKQELNDIIKLGKKIDESNFHNMWVSDHLTYRDVFTTLTMLAVNTKRINLGPGIVNPFSRSLPVIASTILSLNEYSDGRAILGIGAGDKNLLHQFGIPTSKPLTRVRESIIYLREVFKNMTKVPRFNIPRISEIPIYMGAQGPNMLKLAGEIADGVIINSGNPKDIKDSLINVRKGLDIRKNPKDFDILAYLSISLSPDESKARETVLPVVSYVVSSSPQYVLERHSIDLEKVDRIRNYLQKGKYQEAFSIITDNMINNFSIVGKIENVVERISNLAKIGISHCVIGSPLGPDKNWAFDVIKSSLEL
ncbi:MAG: 5,10-methylenetetrahydromethanopterin reductase [Candidatus Ranarchaeia archaeon]